MVLSKHGVTECAFYLSLEATRESAFVHAIASAGVAFAVTRSCAEGSSTICGCDSHHKGSSGDGWKWGGCSEDADFGVLVSREFADARENRPDARSAMNRHNNEAGRAVREMLYTIWVLWDTQLILNSSRPNIQVVFI